MTRKEYYELELGLSEDRKSYLLEHSNLPGPRGNLELMQAFVEMGSESDFIPLLDYTADVAPTGSREEFLAFCGTVGLGELIADGRVGYLPDLRTRASDPRWRIREAVAMGLQIIGKYNPEFFREICPDWISGNYYEIRASIAGISEPRLLKDPDNCSLALELLVKATDSLSKAADQKSAEYLTLKKGLSYCWSVVVSADPEKGKPLFESLIGSGRKEILRIAKENLGKNRMVRMDREWTEIQLGRIAAGKNLKTPG